MRSVIWARWVESSVRNYRRVSCSFPRRLVNELERIEQLRRLFRAGIVTEQRAFNGGGDYELLDTGPYGLPGAELGVVEIDGPAALVTFHSFPQSPGRYDRFA